MQLNTYELWYYGFAGVAISILLVASAYEDWKEWSVNGWLTLVCWKVSLLSAILHPDRNWISVAIVILLMIVCYSPFEIPMFGDADLIPFAFYFAYFNPFAWVSTLSIIGFLVCLLVCLPVYGKVWASAHGEEWHFGDKKPMPMLPCFAMAWVPAVLINFGYLLLNQWR